MVVSADLTRVHHRHTRHDIAESSEQVHGITHTFLLGSVPTVLVMVGDEVHTDSLGTDGGVCLGKIIPQVFHTLLALCYLVHDMMQRPAVVHIEGTLGQFIGFVLILRQGEHIRMGQTQVAHRPVPEIGRYLTRYIAAETVNTDAVHPPMHRFEHLGTHVLVVIVQFGDIRPVVLHHQVSEAVTVMPSLMLRPLAVRSCMVSHPVEDHFEALFVCLFEEMLEVRACAELGVDRAVIDDGVVTAQRTFTGDHTDRLARHDPDDVDAVFLECRQQTFCGSERTFRCCLAGVQLIDRCIVRPFGVTQVLLFFLLRTTHHSQRSQ